MSSIHLSRFRYITYQLPYTVKAAVHDTLTFGPTILRITKGDQIIPFLSKYQWY